MLPEVFLHITIVAFSSWSILRPSLYNHTTVIALGQAEVPIRTHEVFPQWTLSSRHRCYVRIYCSWLWSLQSADSELLNTGLMNIVTAPVMCDLGLGESQSRPGAGMCLIQPWYRPSYCRCKHSINIRPRPDEWLVYEAGYIIIWSWLTQHVIISQTSYDPICWVSVLCPGLLNL